MDKWKPMKVFEQRCNRIKNKFSLNPSESLSYIYSVFHSYSDLPPTCLSVHAPPGFPSSVSYAFTCSLAGPGIYTWAASPLSQKLWGPQLPVFPHLCLGLGSRPGLAKAGW